MHGNIKMTPYIIPENIAKVQPEPLDTVAAIVHLMQAFDKPMHEVRSALDTCDDGCPNQHYTRVVSRDDLG